MNITNADFLFSIFAGLTSVFSACGTPVLFVYLTQPEPRGAIKGNLRRGFTYAGGIVLVFGALGFVALTIGKYFLTITPLLLPAAGISLIGWGLWRYAARYAFFSSILRSRFLSGESGTFSLGVNFGLASFGCSAPILFSLIGYSLTLDGWEASALMFFVYLTAMMVPVLLLSILKASAGFMKDRLRSLQPVIEKITVAVPIAVGGYLLFLYYLAYRGTSGS